MDLTEGPIFRKLIIFVFPVLISGLLQQLYHAADVVVVGNFARDSKTALAAVGSTGALTALILNVFLGLSVGANVVCANLFGAKKQEELSKAMQTAMITALFSGILVSIVGFLFARPMLILMGSPETVIDHATTYVRIIFLGQPASLVYNFGAGILRAYGDTKRPMYILGFSGLINVILNLLFVIVFHWDEAGVALATSIASYISAFLVLRILFHSDGEQQLSFTNLHFYPDQFLRILKIGIPSGLNGAVYSISNVIIMTAINSFGDVVVAGNSAAANIEAVIYQIPASFATASVSFSGQNYGAKKLKRIDKLLMLSIMVSSLCLLALNTAVNIYPSFFLRMFTKDADVILCGIPRLRMVSSFYVLCAVTEITVGCMRGMKQTLLPTVFNAVSICGPRILWVLAIFPLNPQLTFLYTCYPISWTCSLMIQLGYYVFLRRREAKRLKAEEISESAVAA